MRLAHGHGVAALGLPGLGKGGVDVDVQFTRRVVGNIEQAGRRSGLRRAQGAQDCQANGQFADHLCCSRLS
ncbi:hypothetical protein D9M68_846720 [compost metagenome]